MYADKQVIEMGEVEVITDCGPHGAQKKKPKERGPKKGAQRKGAMFIDGPSMNSLMDVHQ